jgi:hypothetical protein
MDNLGERREAVRGAGGVRNQVMRLGIVGVLVHTDHEGRVRVLGRRRDQDLLGAGGDVLARARLVQEQAGAFQCDVDLEVQEAPPVLARAIFCRR